MSYIFSEPQVTAHWAPWGQELRLQCGRQQGEAEDHPVWAPWGRKEKIGSETCWKHPWKKKDWVMALKTADHNRVMRVTYSTDSMRFSYREHLNTARDPDTLRSQPNCRAVPVQTSCGRTGPSVHISFEYDIDDYWPLHTSAVTLDHSLMTLLKTKENEKERTDTIKASTPFSLKKQTKTKNSHWFVFLYKVSAFGKKKWSFVCPKSNIGTLQLLARL